MISRLCVVLFILKLVEDISTLVELPQVEENYILKTDHLIHETTNKLFSIIKLKANERPILRQYSLIHNYLASTSLHDYNSLIVVARITRVDKTKINKQTQRFIAILNSILDEDIKHDEETEDEFVVEHIKGFLKNLDEYTDSYDYNNSNSDIIIAEILDLMKRNNTLYEKYYNITAYTEIKRLKLSNKYSTVANDTNEFWVPNARRIYHGKKASIRDFPFMASIQMFNHFQCAGSIIKSDLIITAASCLHLVWNNRFFKENPSFLSARVGSTYLNDGGDNIPILEVHFHPQYDPKILRHNLCLLRLHKTLSLKKKSTFKKIEIDRDAHPLPLNINGVTIIGWGARQSTDVDNKACHLGEMKAKYISLEIQAVSLKSSNTITDPFLSFAVLDVYSTEECQDVYSGYVTRNNFCAGFTSRGSGACNRDIGGPGIVQGVLSGVVSFSSPSCGTPNAPTVFTKLGYYTDWIENIMEQDVIIGKKLTTHLLPLPIFDIPYVPARSTPNVTRIITHKKPTTSIDEEAEKYFTDNELSREFLRKTSNNPDVVERIPSTYSPVSTLEKHEIASTLLDFTKQYDDDLKISSSVESYDSSENQSKQIEAKSKKLIINVTKNVNLDFYKTVSDKEHNSIEMKNIIIKTLVELKEAQNKNKNINSSYPKLPYKGKVHPIPGNKNKLITLMNSSNTDPVDSEIYYEEDSNERGLEILTLKESTSFIDEVAARLLKDNKSLREFINQISNNQRVVESMTFTYSPVPALHKELQNIKIKKNTTKLIGELKEAQISNTLNSKPPKIGEVHSLLENENELITIMNSSNIDSMDNESYSEENSNERGLEILTFKKSTTFIRDKETENLVDNDKFSREFLHKLFKSDKMKRLPLKASINSEAIERIPFIYSPVQAIELPEISSTVLHTEQDIYETSEDEIKQSFEVKSNKSIMEITRSLNKDLYQTVKDNERHSTSIEIKNNIDKMNIELKEAQNKSMNLSYHKLLYKGKIHSTQKIKNKLVHIINSSNADTLDTDTYNDKDSQESELDIDPNIYFIETILQNKTSKDKLLFFQELSNIFSEILEEELEHYNKSITKNKNSKLNDNSNDDEKESVEVKLINNVTRSFYHDFYQTVTDKDRQIIKLKKKKEKNKDLNLSYLKPPYIGELLRNVKQTAMLINSSNVDSIDTNTYSDKDSEKSKLEIDRNMYCNETILQNKTSKDKFMFFKELSNIFSEILKEELENYNKSLAKNN